MSRNSIANACVATIPSDAHSWNLIYLELLLTDAGLAVTNLGPCTPIDILVTFCRELRPELIVISSVNGLAALEAPSIAERLRRYEELSGSYLVLGGKVDTAATVGQDADVLGFDDVFLGEAAVCDFMNSCAKMQIIAQGI